MRFSVWEVGLIAFTPLGVSMMLDWFAARRRMARGWYRRD